MAGLVEAPPAIHVPGRGSKKGVDHRDEPGDDDERDRGIVLLPTGPTPPSRHTGRAVPMPEMGPGLRRDDEDGGLRIVSG